MIQTRFTVLLLRFLLLHHLLLLSNAYPQSATSGSDFISWPKLLNFTTMNQTDGQINDILQDSVEEGTRIFRSRYPGSPLLQVFVSCGSYTPTVGITSIELQFRVQNQARIIFQSSATHFRWRFDSSITSLPPCDPLMFDDLTLSITEVWWLLRGEGYAVPWTLNRIFKPRVPVGSLAKEITWAFDQSRDWAEKDLICYVGDSTRIVSCNDRPRGISGDFVENQRNLTLSVTAART